METPSFTFRLRRVRDLRERAEEHAREQLARELQLRMRGEALLREATHAVDAARDTGSGIFRRTGAKGAVSELPAATPYASEITAAARKRGVGPALLAGLVKQESDFDPDAGSPAGAQGLRQLMPATAASLGVTTSTIRSRRSRAARSTCAGSSTASAATSPARSPPTTPVQAPSSASGAYRRMPRRRSTSAASRRTPPSSAPPGSAGAASTARTAVLSTSPSIHGIV